MFKVLENGKCIKWVSNNMRGMRGIVLSVAKILKKPNNPWNNWNSYTTYSTKRKTALLNTVLIIEFE